MQVLQIKPVGGEQQPGFFRAEQALVRGGAGLVRLATPTEVLPVVAAANPCYMTAPLPQDEQGMCSATAADILRLAVGQSVVAIGPGLGQSKALVTLLTDLLPQLRVPVVVDADGLNNLGGQLNMLVNCTAPVIFK